jgi:hypothetical protein
MTTQSTINVRANNENVNYLNQMQIQNHLMNVDEVENRMKQNANLQYVVSDPAATSPDRF